MGNRNDLTFTDTTFSAGSSAHPDYVQTWSGNKKTVWSVETVTVYMTPNPEHAVAVGRSLFTAENQAALALLGVTADTYDLDDQEEWFAITLKKYVSTPQTTALSDNTHKAVTDYLRAKFPDYTFLDSDTVTTLIQAQAERERARMQQLYNEGTDYLRRYAQQLGAAVQQPADQNMLLQATAPPEAPTAKQSFSQGLFGGAVWRDRQGYLSPASG